jgi:2'-5' RNA ligase
MTPTACRFALVAYVRSSAGQWVEQLWRELHPGLPALAAHLTILPPRQLTGDASEAIAIIQEACGSAAGFEVELGEVDTFVPATPTLFIRVARGAEHMQKLHAQLHRGALAGEEQWEYMPHLTIAKMETLDQARQAFQVASEKWAKFGGSRSIPITELTFVREDELNCWSDLASCQLGNRVAAPQEP